METEKCYSCTASSSESVMLHKGLTAKASRSARYRSNYKGTVTFIHAASKSTKLTLFSFRSADWHNRMCHCLATPPKAALVQNRNQSSRMGIFKL